MSNLQQAFIRHLEIERITKKAYCDRTKVHPADLSRFINDDKLCKQIRNTIFDGWSSALTEIDLLENYFKDLVIELDVLEKVKKHPITIK